MQVTNDDASCCLKIAGELNISVSDVLRDALRDSLGRLPELTLDLSEVDSCDTAALQLLLSAVKSAARANKPCRMKLSAAILEAGATLGLSLEKVSGVSASPLPAGATSAGPATLELASAI